SGNRWCCLRDGGDWHRELHARHPRPDPRTGERLGRRRRDRRERVHAVDHRHDAGPASRARPPERPEDRHRASGRRRRLRLGSDGEPERTSGSQHQRDHVDHEGRGHGEGAARVCGHEAAEGQRFRAEGPAVWSDVMGFPNVSAVGALLGLNRPQDWRDRIKEGAYTSPGGTRIIFDFEDVSRETEKWTTAFAFRGVRDEYVQDNGHGSRKYPLRCIFSGDDCDRLATAFEAALLETGIGRLEHPLYGTFDVVPFGTISRRDGLKDQANVSVVEVTFW